MQNEDNLISSIQDMKIFSADDVDKNEIAFKEIISDSEITVVSFLRRFGCPVCR